MRNLIYFGLIILAYSVNGEDGGNIFSGYFPSGGSLPFSFDTFKKCYEYAMEQFEESGYRPGGSRIGVKGEEGASSSSSSSFSNMMSNPQFEQIFKKCMEEEKPSSSNYSKRAADGDNMFSGYIPSGSSLPFSFETFKKCYEYAAQKFEESGYRPGGSRIGVKGEEGASSSSSSSFSNMMSNPQFEQIFKKCMEQEKPSSSNYSKRAADGDNMFTGYIPSGSSLPFSFETFKKCYEYATQKFEESGYRPGGSRIGVKGEEGASSSSSSSFSNMMSNPQFEQIFKKCMEEEKPSSSNYSKRAADGDNMFSGYIPSGSSLPFSFETFKKCYEYATQKFEESGYRPGGSRIGVKGEEGASSSSSSSFSNMMSNPQFEQIFKKCMEQEKPSSSNYSKRAADGDNMFSGYIPSGSSLPFSFETFKKCYEYATQKFEESGYRPGGSRIGVKGEEGASSSSSSSFSNMMSNPQFEQIFKKCMEEEKPSSSNYSKRAADGDNMFSGYIPSGSSLPFSFETFKKCYEYATQKFEESGYRPGGSRIGVKGEEGASSSSSSSFSNMMSNPQFEQIFKKCMEQEKPSTYKKRSTTSEARTSLALDPEQAESERAKAMRYISLFY